MIEKSIDILKNGGKLLSITPTLNNFGFYASENHICIPTNGGGGFTGAIRYCDDKDIDDLYNGKNYKITDATICQQSQGNVSYYEVYVIEVAKI